MQHSAPQKELGLPSTLSAWTDRLTIDMLDVDEQRVVRWSLQDSADVTWSYEEVLMPPNDDGGAYRGSVSAILPFSQ